MKPDLLLFNVRAITLDPSYPVAELIAVGGGRILHLAGNEELKKLKSRRAVIIDGRKKTVCPGFHDAHIHLPAFAKSLLTINLAPGSGIRSIKDIRAQIKHISHKIPHMAWIRAAGYDEFHLAEKRHPDRRDLDGAAPNHPVKLTHRSGHAHVLNSLALKLTGISRDTEDPSGALIERDTKSGEPTGVLFGMGTFLSQRIPPIGQELLEQGIRMANRELISLGITSIQDCSATNDMSRWKMFRSWKESGLLNVRVNMMIGSGSFSECRQSNFFTHAGQEQLRAGGVKIILDEITGRLNPTQEELNELTLRIHKAGLQAAFHAVEEPTAEAACAAIENALQLAPRTDHRHRIEHCSVCPPLLTKRLASIRAFVVTQPSFIYGNGDRYLETVPGRQLRDLYPLGRLLKNGVQVAAGSDCPIGPANPMLGIYAGVSRRTDTGNPVLPEEKVSPKEMIRMYTDSAARVNFEEEIKGSITPGKVADLVVLSADPTRISVDEIKNIRVEMTILGGRVIWDNEISR